MKCKKVIIWGHKLYSHTFSYIHYGFYKAFVALGYETYWLNDSDDVSNMNFDNCLFLTEGQVDKNIPINKTSKYIVHSCNEERYANVKKINIQIFHSNIIGAYPENTHPTFSTLEPLTKINNYTYVSKQTVYQPWATDLLPNEIDLNSARNEKENKECVWVGTYGDRTGEFQNSIELDLFFNECRKNDILVTIINGWAAPVSPEENKKIINQSFVAPAIQGPWQVKHGYAPHCRILKNISYGHLGITNNEKLNILFDNKLVYDNDPVLLFYKVLEKKNESNIIEEIKYLMNEVKNKHTYINRAQILLSVLEEI